MKITEEEYKAVYIDIEIKGSAEKRMKEKKEFLMKHKILYRLSFLKCKLFGHIIKNNGIVLAGKNIQMNENNQVLGIDGIQCWNCFGLVPVPNSWGTFKKGEGFKLFIT